MRAGCLMAFFTALAMGQAWGFRKYSADLADRVAIGGYDPVVYAETGRAEKGAPIFFHEWEGVIWRFINKANQRKFAGEPEKFAPALGGYCATGLALGKAAECDPRFYAIHKGKLYLFGNAEARDLWLQDPEKYIALGEKAYAQLMQDVQAKG